MVYLQLTNKEWYFLHVQMENIIKEQPDNHIARELRYKLGENCPNLDDIKKEFKLEYNCEWINNG